MPVEREAAPLPLGAERHLRAHGCRLRRFGIVDRLERAVAGRRAGREQGDVRSEPGLSTLDRGLERHETKAVIGQGAGLVETDDVDACEALDGVDALRKGPKARKAHGRDGEREARQQHESLGHERKQPGNGRASGLPDRCVAKGQRRDEEDRERHHDHHGDPQDAVDVELERAQRGAGAAGLGGKPLRVAVGADRLDHVVGRSRGAEDSREDRSRRRHG